MTATQLELMQEMNRTLQQQAEILNTISERLSGQSAAFQEVTSSAEELAPALEDNSAKAGLFEGALKGVTEQWESFTGVVKKFVGEDNFNAFFNAGAEAFNLLGINVTSLADAISNPLAAALGFLGNSWDILVGHAADLAHQGTAFARALEDVREKFGDLTQNTSRQVVDVGRNMSASLREAAGGTGAFASKFSPGVDGAIERMHMAMEIAGDLGSTFDALGKDFSNASDELYVLKKGLDFTGEGLQATARLAMLGGQSLKSFSQGIMASIDKIGKQFGMSTKVLGGDVGKALSNFKMLGKMTGDYVKEITKAAVFTRKLGIELNTLTGLVDKFDDFEQGAEAAAQLAQGFGLVVDPLKMMGMEAGPRLAELQKAFVATGRSIDSMSRQERSLLAQTSGLSDEQVQLAFSQKGLSMSYDEISKGADAAAKRQATTQEIMNDLALNIKNVIVDMQQFTGFITAFFSGFGAGFGGSRGVMGIIRELAKQLTQVYHIGFQVGRLFSTVLFSGSSETSAKGLAQSIGRIGQMFVNIANNIKDFVDSIKSVGEGGDISGAVSRLITNIFGNINSAFTGATGNISIFGMAKRFGTFMLQVLNGALKWLVTTGIPGWIVAIRSSFTGTGPSSVTGGAVDAMGTAIQGITDNLGLLLPLLKDLGVELLKMIPRIFENFPIASTVASMFVAGGPVLAFITSFGSEFMSNLWSQFGNVAKAGADTGAVGANQAAVAANVTAGVGETMESAVGTTAVAGAGIFERLFNIIEDPAKIAAYAAGIGIAIKTVGIAIRDTMLAFMDPLPGRGVSFIDVLASSAAKFSSINVSDLLTIGVILGGIMAAIGILVTKIAGAFSSMPTSTMFIGAGLGVVLSPVLVPLAAALGISVGTGLAGLQLGKLMGGVASAITSMLTGVVDAFTDPTFIASIRSAAALGASMAGEVAGISSLASVMSSVVTLVTGAKTALDALSALAPDLDAASSTDREIAKQNMLEKIGLISITISSVASSISVSFNNIASAFPADAIQGGKTSEQKITQGASMMTALASSMGSIVSIMTSLGTINSTFATVVPTNWMGAQPEELVNGIKRALAVIFGTVNNPELVVVGGPVEGNPGILGALSSIPAINLGDIKSRIDGMNSIQQILTAFTGVISSMSTATPESMQGFADAALKMSVTNGPIYAIHDLMTSSTGLLLLADIKPGDMQGKIDSVFNVLDHYIERSGATSESMASEKQRQFATRLAKITNQVATTRRILEDLGTIPLDATIDKVAQNMSVAKSVFSINGGAVKISVNMNVTMNAEKISSNLVMSGFLAPQQGFKEYLLSTDGVGETFEAPETEFSKPRVDNNPVNYRYAP